VRLCRLGDNSERGPAEALDPEKARTQRHALFRAELGRVLVPEYKRAGNSPFTGFRRPLENKRIRRVEPDGPRKSQHVRLIRVSDRALADRPKRPWRAQPQGWPARAAPCRSAGGSGGRR